MKSKKSKNQKDEKAEEIQRTNRFEKQNDESNDLLKLIQHKLKFSANNVHRQSLWQVACSVQYWLTSYQQEHPIVKRNVTARENVRRYLNDARVVKLSYRAKLGDCIDGIEFSGAEIFLLTGFLMGIKACSELTDIDTEKAAVSYRLTVRQPTPLDPEYLKKSQAYWALRN